MDENKKKQTKAQVVAQKKKIPVKQVQPESDDEDDDDESDLVQ